ncbi:MAG: methylenetetrahydrofolate reductase [Gammaproteobacteria bacterium]|nr:methylenetetrahydrofolate reductase [Gammaproteobacteria bacterium]
MTHIDSPPEGSGELSGLSSDGRLERVLKFSQFAVTAELAPPDSADPEEVYQRAALFADCVDAINATDGSGANCHMSSVGVCSLLTRRGYSMVMQVSCRDRNRIAIQGDVLGAAAMGVANILCLTGDGVQAGDEPEAKPVFDLDSVTLLHTVRMMRDEAHFLTRRPLTIPPRIFLGASVNPFVPPHDFQVYKLEKKIDAGAQFIQTQYCYDLPMLKSFMEQVRDRELHRRAYILVGIGVPSSAESARWMREHIPGVHIPDTVIKRLQKASDPRAEGAKISVELLQAIREMDGIAGVHIMAYKRESDVAELIDRSAIIADRKIQPTQA